MSVPTLDEWVEKNCPLFSENIAVTLDVFGLSELDKEDLHRMIMLFHRQSVENESDK